MATVNGFTAEHMQTIKDGTITSASLVNYELIFTKYNNTTLNVGNVRGATGTIACTSATRPASPTVGQIIYETDTGKQLIYYGATTLWRQPWNMPWGIIANMTDTGTRTFTTTATAITNVTASVPMLLNRYYELNFTCRYTNSSASQGNSFVIRRNGTAITSGLAVNPGTTFDQSFSLVSHYKATATSSTTWDVAAFNSAGTTTINGANLTTQFTIKDVGPLTETPPAT